MRPKTCDEMRALVGEFLSTAPGNERQRFWDIITCQRGPDSPSERGEMADSEASAAYQLRRKRKRDTVEVIRAMSFGGVVGGAARYRTDIQYVTLPPSSQWDHFDRHVYKAAMALGIEIRQPKASKKGGECEATVGGATSLTKEGKKYIDPFWQEYFDHPSPSLVGTNNKYTQPLLDELNMSVFDTAIPEENSSK